MNENESTLLYWVVAIVAFILFLYLLHYVIRNAVKTSVADVLAERQDSQNRLLAVLLFQHGVTAEQIDFAMKDKDSLQRLLVNPEDVLKRQAEIDAIKEYQNKS